jgi:hypothetical protein
MTPETRRTGCWTPARPATASIRWTRRWRGHWRPLAATGTQARVLVIGPVPELTASPPYCVAMARRLHRREQACWDMPAQLPLVRARAAEAAIARALKDRPDVAVAYPSRQLCTEVSCVTALRRRLLYFDDDHLSASGARMLVPAWMDEALRGRSGPPAVPPPAVPPPPRR